MMVALIALFVVAVILAIIPAWPAIAEWRLPRDSQPLGIAESYPEEHHIVARNFGDEVAADLKDAVHAFIASGGQPGMGVAVLKGRYDIIGPHSERSPDFEFGEQPLVLVQHQSRTWPAGMRLSRQTYVSGAFESGLGSTLDRLYVDGDLYLGEESVVAQWAHARRDVRAMAGCRLYGSVAAGRLLQVWPGCRFERLAGGEIRFGDEWHWPEAPVPSGYQEEELPPLFRLNGRARRQGNCHHIGGNLVIPARHVWRGDLVIQGNLRLNRGARVEGSIKAEGNVLLETGSSVSGQLFSESTIEVRSGARITGIASTEGDLRVRWGAEIGAPGAPSTASGRRVLMDQGARVFGVVVALEDGRVALRTVARLAA